MSTIVVFSSGHAVPASKMGLITPTFIVRRSVDLVINGCSKNAGSEPVVALATVVEVDAEHTMVQDDVVDKKGTRASIIVGRQRGAYRLSSTFDTLVNSDRFAALDDEVRDEAMKLLRYLSKWHTKYGLALAPAGEVLPATPVVASEEDVRERDPNYCERRFNKNAAKLRELLNEHGLEEDTVGEPASGIFELLDFCSEKGIVIEDEADLRDSLSDLPIEDLVSPSGKLPDFNDFVAAARQGAADEETVDSEAVKVA